MKTYMNFTFTYIIIIYYILFIFIIEKINNSCII